MKSLTPGLNIKSVARLSGVSEHVLRAWEKRYRAVKPERSGGGHRLYSPADVEKLKLLALLVDRGHAIGTIAKCQAAELATLAQALEPTAARAPARALNRPLVAALETHDFDALDRLLMQARIDLSCRDFVLEVASPLLTDVGRLVAQGALEISQEHAFSVVLRNHLGELLSHVQRAYPWSLPARPERPLLAFATPEGELHEFGILLSALLAGAHGLKFRYLGPNLPPESLARAAGDLGATTVVLGATTSASASPAERLIPYVDRLLAALPASTRRRIQIWVGGPGRNGPISPANPAKMSGPISPSDLSHLPCVSRSFASLAAFDAALAVAARSTRSHSSAMKR